MSTKAPASKTRRPAVVKAKTTATVRDSESAKKSKLVRDSFTMPDGEYAAIGEIKQRCLARGREAKKSEVLRAAVHLLAGLSDAALLRAIGRLDPIKAGRPAKHRK
jgi:hypothetical protein